MIPREVEVDERSSATIPFINIIINTQCYSLPSSKVKQIIRKQNPKSNFSKTTTKFTAITNFSLLSTVGNFKCNPHVFLHGNETSLNSTSTVWVKPYGRMRSIPVQKNSTSSNVKGCSSLNMISFDSISDRSSSNSAIKSWILEYSFDPFSRTCS